MPGFRLRSLAPFLVLPVLLLPPVAQAATPFANNDTAENFGFPLVVDVLANDGDADGEALVVTAGGSGSSCATCQGTVSVIQGLIRFEPASTRPAACTICYSITDENGESAAASVTITAGALAIFADGFETRDTSKWSETVP